MPDPDEREVARLTREESERRREEADARLSRIEQNHLEEVLAKFQTLAGKLTPMNQDQEAIYRWKYRIAPAMGAAGIEPRHQIRVTKWHPEQRTVFERCRDYCQNRGAIVILTGARGCGKTTIPIQMMLERIEAWCTWNDTAPDLRTMAQPPEPGQYQKLSRLGSMFKALYSAFGSTRTEFDNGLFETWCRAPFVCIDEIHEAEDLPAATRMLVDLLDRRYAKLRDTILISNYDPGKCQSVISPSILSRITENGAIIPCQWESFRSRQQKLL